jgi:hypothetical protein
MLGYGLTWSTCSGSQTPSYSEKRNDLEAAAAAAAAGMLNACLSARCFADKLY